MSSSCPSSPGKLYETSAGPGGLELIARGLNLAGVTPGARIIDIGCGSGEAVQWMRASRGLEAFGIDCARERFHIGGRLVQGDGGDLPFTSGAFDAVLAQCSFSIIRRREAALRECARVLVPRGVLIVADVYDRGGPDASGRWPALLPFDDFWRQLAAQRFHPLLWEDHSRVLSQFLFRFVMEHGSLDGLWNAAGRDGTRSCSLGASVRGKRPGYFLLIARTEGE